MRQLIVCCDGTWNTPEDKSVTNVRRLYNALADKNENDDPQLAYYQPGVGTMRNRLLGGGVGLGLSRNVMDAYLWLATRYEPGDRIALFGFSRGAYTARSLAGMISACGLIDTTKMRAAEIWPRIRELYTRGYRQRVGGDLDWRDGFTFRWDPVHAEDIPVNLIGVWDTVGALGIPDYLGWLNLLDPLHRYDFHDLRLNPHIKHGRHAVAMDERRKPYAPAMWDEPMRGQDIKQVWFPGSHKDVGGGHPERGLSDGALRWMIDEARDTIHLGFHKGTVEDQISPDPLDILHDDDRGMVGLLEPVVDPALKPLMEVFLQPRPRAVPRIEPNSPSPHLHESVYERHQNPTITGGPYRPTRVLAPEQEKTIEVFAHDPWNETGLYLEPGDYMFIAEGVWQDGAMLCGPGGAPGPGGANPLAEGVRLLGRVWNGGRRLFRFVSGNKMADFIGTRREPELPWMSMVGVVANDAVSVNGRAHDHERIPIGTGTRCRVTKGGYLYAFANDAWGFYRNNQGSIRLTVTRLPAEEHLLLPSYREADTALPRAGTGEGAEQMAGAGGRPATAGAAPRRTATGGGARGAGARGGAATTGTAPRTQTGGGGQGRRQDEGT
jgi:hypothetical protein